MVEQRIKELCGQIDLHNKKYYLEDAPLISDAEYDKLFRELLALEESHPSLIAPDSPSRRVGTAPVSELPTVKHRFRMFSLSNAYTDKEFDAFFKGVTKIDVASLATPSIVLEHKFDGLALELVYENGLLIEASTRGDGEEGELVTENIRTIRNVPLRLQGPAPSLLVVYGEAMILKNDFEKLNAKRAADGEKPFANPRNAAAGSVRLLDSRKSAERRLLFYAYDCKTTDENSSIYHLNAHTMRMDALKEMGFTICPERKVIHSGNTHEAYSYYREVAARRPDLPYQIDGLVAKVVTDEVREILGYAERFPKWAVAWKFDAEEAETELLSIEYEVGRSGVLTPVANLSPTDLGGVTVSRASLHNFDYIFQHDFRVGDSVIIKRAGDVIPYIIRYLPEKRPSDAAPVAPPLACPSCGTPPVREVLKSDDESSEKALRCPNALCPARIQARLKYFVSKQGLDIEGLGNRQIEEFFKQGFLGTKDASYIDLFASVFSLHKHKEAILHLEGFGEKSVENLFSNIDKARRLPLASFLQALGIRGLGAVSSSKLARTFTNFHNIIAAYKEGGSEYEAFRSLEAVRDQIEYAVGERPLLQKEVADSKDLLNNLLTQMELARFSGKDGNIGAMETERISFEAECEAFTHRLKETDTLLARLRREEAALNKKVLLGPAAAENLIRYFNDLRSQKELALLLESGVEIKEEETEEKPVLLRDHPYFGKRILVTGKSEHLETRTEMLDFLTALGAEYLAGITRNTDIVLSCTKPGPDKIRKALEYGVPVLAETEFFANLPSDIIDSFRRL